MENTVKFRSLATADDIEAFAWDVKSALRANGIDRASVLIEGATHIELIRCEDGGQVRHVLRVHNNRQ